MGEDNRLVFSYLLDRGGGGQTVDWQKIKQWSPEEGTLWMHLNHASENVQKWLTEASGLDPISCESLLEEETRPRVVSSSDGLLLILRGVNCNPGADPEDMVSLRMLFNETASLP
jgi:zinc transporter